MLEYVWILDNVYGQKPDTHIVPKYRNGKNGYQLNSKGSYWTALLYNGFIHRQFSQSHLNANIVTSATFYWHAIHCCCDFQPLQTRSNF